MSTRCWGFTVPELKQMCKQRGIKGYSSWNKSELVKECCATSDVQQAPAPRERTREMVPPESSPRMSSYERERAERKERERLEKERRNRQEKEREEKILAIKADIDTIKPSNIKKIKHVKDYKKKDEEYQLELVENIHRGSWGMQNPMYVGADTIPCPASINVLRAWMENGYVNDERAGRDGGSRIRFGTISLSSSSWKGKYNDLAQIDARESPNGMHEVIVIANENVRRDVMEKRLKRFRGVFGKQCFELDSSDSKELYGIFLKK